ncbi:MAG: hypothetical protein M9962_04005 [Oligoflexia bacterium]|nr:hypothetical protein [Oligoflexia bacterium]
MDALKEFLSLGNEHVRVVPDVKFRINVRGNKIKTGRDLLVISTYGLDTKKVKEKYLKTLMNHSVSFPMRERGKHLKVRINDKVYNFGRFVINWIPRFRTRQYRTPWSRALETVILLSDQEKKNLDLYLKNIKRRRRKVIGGFSMESSAYTKGELYANRTANGLHNCTSWIATAPIGENNKPLLELLGGDRELPFYTNPGWFTSWIAATADAKRLPFVIYWTSEPLEQVLSKDIRSGSNFPWDFNKH